MIENMDWSALAVVIPIIAAVASGIGNIIQGIKNKDQKKTSDGFAAVIEGIKSLMNPAATTTTEQQEAAVKVLAPATYEMEEDTLNYLTAQFDGHASKNVIQAAVKQMEAAGYMEYGILAFDNKTSGITASKAAFISYGAVYYVGDALEVTNLVNSRPQCGIISIAG